jgi:hypothetical protein
MAEQQQWYAGKPDYEHEGLALASDTAAYSGHLGKALELTNRAVDSAINIRRRTARPFATTFTWPIWPTRTFEPSSIFGVPPLPPHSISVRAKATPFWKWSKPRAVLQEFRSALESKVRDRAILPASSRILPRESAPELAAHDVRFKRDRRIRVGLEEKSTQWLRLAGDGEIVLSSLSPQHRGNTSGRAPSR